LEKTCLSGLSLRFLWAIYFFSMSAHALGMPILLVFPPLPFIFSEAPFGWNCMFPTVRSHISSALAPLAYIRLRRTMSLRPVSLQLSGNLSSIVTSCIEKTALFFLEAFFIGILLILFLKTDAAAKLRFWAYPEKDTNADSLWFFVDALQPRSSSIHIKNSINIS